jgi:hypothetical protein
MFCSLVVGTLLSAYRVLETLQSHIEKMRLARYNFHDVNYDAPMFVQQKLYIDHLQLFNFTVKKP